MSHYSRYLKTEGARKTFETPQKPRKIFVLADDFLPKAREKEVREQAKLQTAQDIFTELDKLMNTSGIAENQVPNWILMLRDKDYKELKKKYEKKAEIKKLSKTPEVKA